jgi:hypothetical protein
MGFWFYLECGDLSPLWICGEAAFNLFNYLAISSHFVATLARAWACW